jgi:U4/U6.U5 tri-snRNP-associated protein 3
MLSVYIFLFLSILPPLSFLHCYTLRLIVLTYNIEDSIPSSPRKRYQHESDDNRERKKQRAVVSDFVDGITREQLEKKESDNNDNAGIREGGGLMDEDEIEMMKQLGIPTRLDSIQGKLVFSVNVSRVRAVTKRQPK